MALHELLRQAADLGQKIAALAERQQNMSIEWARQLQSGAAGAELQFAQFCAHTMEAWQQQLAQQRRELDARISRQRAAWTEARQARQVFENLRDHQHQAYRLAEERRVQRRLDDLFLLSRGPSRAR